MEIKRNEIKVPTGKIGEMALEFDKSRVTIENALKDITQSDLAKEIRKRAIEILQEEIKGAKV